MANRPKAALSVIPYRFPLIVRSILCWHRMTHAQTATSFFLGAYLRTLAPETGLFKTAKRGHPGEIAPVLSPAKPNSSAARRHARLSFRCRRRRRDEEAGSPLDLLLWTDQRLALVMPNCATMPLARVPGIESCHRMSLARQHQPGRKALIRRAKSVRASSPSFGNRCPQ